MRFEYTGVFEMLGNGLGLGLLISVGALGVLWGILYLLDRVFPEARHDQSPILKLVKAKVETLDEQGSDREHRKAA